MPIEPGENLADVVNDLVPFTEDVAANVNGRILTRDQFHAVTIQPHDVIQVRTLAGNTGGGESNPVAAALTLAVLIAAPYAATGLGFAAGTAAHAAATAAIAAVGVIAVNAIFPVDPIIDDTTKQDRQFSISGGGNLARPYEPFTLILGRHRVFPDLVAKEYQDFDDEGQQYSNQIYDFGLGENLHIEELQLGETPLQNFHRVYVQKAGAVGFTLPFAWGSSANIVEIALRLIGGLPVLSLVSGNVDTAVGGDLLEVNDEGRPTRAISLTRRTGQDSIEYAVDLLSIHFRLQDRGRITGRDIRFRIEHRLADSAGAWTEAAVVTLSSPSNANARNAVRRSYKYQVDKGQYDVRISLAYPIDPESGDPVLPNLDDEKLTFQASVLAVRSFQEDQADFSGRNPLAVRAKATGQLYGRMENLNSIASQHLPSWDSTTDTWTPPRATSNPGDLAVAFLRGWRIGDKLAAGFGLADGEFEIEQFQRFAEHCEAHGLECNLVLQGDSRDEYAVLAVILRCGWGRIDTSSGKVGVLWEDAGRPVSAVVSPANIVADSLTVTYEHEDLADEIVGTFVDRDSGYERNDVRRPIPQETIVGEFPVDIDMEGITERSHATKQTNLVAAHQFYHPRTISWATTEQGFLGFTVGSVVAMANGLVSKGDGGRLLEIGADRRTLVTSFNASRAGGFAWVWLLDGEVHATPYRAGANDSEIVLTDALPAVPEHVTEDPLSYQVACFPEDYPYHSVRIVGLRPEGEGRYRYFARDEVPEYYQHRSTDGQPEFLVPAQTGQSIPVGGFAVTVNNLGVRIFSWTPHPFPVLGYEIRYGPPGTAFDDMTQLHDGLLGAPPFEVMDRPADGTWQFGIVAVIAATTHPTPPSFLRATLGATPDAGGVENVLVPPILDVPPEPVIVRLHSGFTFLALEFVNPFRQYANHKTAHIYRHTANNLAAAQEIGTTDYFVYVDSTVLAEVTYYYWVVFENTDDVRGPFSDVVSGKTAPDLDAYHDRILADIRADPLAEALLEPITNPAFIAAEIDRLSALAALLAADAEKVLEDAINDVGDNVTLANAEIVSIQQDIVRVRAELAGKATSAALMALAALVSTNEDGIEALSRQLTRLTSTVAGKADASALNLLQTRVTTVEGRVTSEALRLTRLETTVAGKASATAVDRLVTRVTTAEGRITTISRSITQLMTDIQGKANASAVRLLETRVTTAEGKITSQATDITNLKTSVAGKADASALRSLTTRVSTAEGKITSQATDITNLAVEVAGKATASALNLLTARVTTAEGKITSQATDITNLAVEVAGKASSSAVTALATRVTTAESDIDDAEADILAQASQITTLRASIAGKAEASAQQLLEVRVRNNENVAGSSSLSTLARWLVKTTVRGLTGGVGLVNDGSSTRFYVRADSFAILPRTLLNSDINNAKVPFRVVNGVVWLNEALIGNATIDNAHIKVATIDELRLNSALRGKVNKVSKWYDQFQYSIGDAPRSSPPSDGTTGNLVYLTLDANYITRASEQLVSGERYRLRLGSRRFKVWELRSTSNPGVVTDIYRDYGGFPP